MPIARRHRYFPGINISQLQKPSSFFTSYCGIESPTSSTNTVVTADVPKISLPIQATLIPMSKIRPLLQLLIAILPCLSAAAVTLDEVNAGALRL